VRWPPHADVALETANELPASVVGRLERLPYVTSAISFHLAMFVSAAMLGLGAFVNGKSLRTEGQASTRDETRWTTGPVEPTVPAA